MAGSTGLEPATSGLTEPFTPFRKVARCLQQLELASIPSLGLVGSSLGFWGGHGHNDGHSLAVVDGPCFPHLPVRSDLNVDPREVRRTMWCGAASPLSTVNVPQSTEQEANR